MAGFRPANVAEFLQHLGLAQHTRLLEGQGYDNLGDLFLLSEQDLDCVHIMNGHERVSILSAVENIDISSWLSYHGLTNYEHLFRQYGLSTVGELKKTEFSDDLMDELEVMVPGHRKRLSIAASHICKSSDDLVAVTASGTSSSRDIVATGYWDRKDEMPTMSCDLLWIDCAMKSNVPGADPIPLTCLVDTASEVVTCKEDIVQTLALEFIKYVDSKGIHTNREKPIHKGTLILGNRELEVEVMPDVYNSVGCNVVRKFCHYINENGHIWFGQEG